MKPNSSQEIEKNTPRQTKNTLKWPPGTCYKNFFSAVVSIGVIQKTSLQTFMRKDLIALNRGTPPK